MKKTMALIFMIAIGGMLCGQTITITSPHQQGEIWGVGEHHDVTWTFSGYPAGTKVELFLFHEGVNYGPLVCGSEMSSAVNVDIGSDGMGKFHYWHVPLYGFKPDIHSAPNGSGYWIVIRDMNHAFPAASSTMFMINEQVLLNLPMRRKSAPMHLVHSRGQVTIHRNMGCDLDSGHELATPGCDDFRWHQNSDPPRSRIFTPCPGALFKALGEGAEQSYEYVRFIKLHQHPIPDADLPLNVVVAYQTNQGRRGALRVMAKGADGSLTLNWVTYQN
jgi:hypothetical protein